MRLRKDARDRGLIVGSAAFVGIQPPHVTLHVPARPEALGIVRLVMMSCGASAGLGVEEIFAVSREVVDAFTNVLVQDPDVRSVVIRTQTGASGVDLVPVHGSAF